MKRREFLANAGAAALWPVAGRAQQARMPTIGYLSSNSPEIPVGEVAAFKEGLNAAGFVENRDVTIEYRFAEGSYDRLSAFAAELVTRHVDVVAASGLPAALAAKSATTRIPIVFTIGVDPVAHGLVKTLREPGGNLTGVTQLGSALAEKELQLILELTPGATAVGFLINPTNPNSATLNSLVGSAARSLRVQIVPLSAVTKDEIEAAFAAGREKGVGALLIGGDAFLRTQGEQLVWLAARYAIPTMYDEPEYVMAGGLVSYGTRRSEMRRQAGVYVGRVLKGSRPADLPVMQPTKFELVVNLKTAKALGLTVPQSILARADDVIE